MPGSKIMAIIPIGSDERGYGRNKRPRFVSLPKMPGRGRNFEKIKFFYQNPLHFRADYAKIIEL